MRRRTEGARMLSNQGYAEKHNSVAGSSEDSVRR